MKHGYIGTRLRDARVSKKITVQQLARDMEIPIETVLDIEAGATLGHSSTIIEMGSMLGLSLADLFGPTEESNIIPFPQIERDK